MRNVTLGRRADGVYQALRESIQSGELGPGDRLPTQRELVERFSASLPTVNRAIRRLCQEQLIWTRAGAGAYVRQRPAGPSAFIGYMYLNQQDYLDHAQQAALERGFLLSVYSQLQARWNPNAERMFLRTMLDQRHHALLAFCSPTEPTNDDLLARLEAAGVRVLHTEHYRVALPDQPYLLPDFERAGWEAVEACLARGYRQVCHLSQACPGKAVAPYARLLNRGMTQAMAAHGTQWRLDDCWLEFPDSENHEERLRRSLERVGPDTAVIAQTGTAADHALEMLRRLGRDVPGDVGLIAFDVLGNRDSGDVDTLSFGRQKLFERAIEAVTGPTWDAPRELVPPTWLKRGTMR